MVMRGVKDLLKVIGEKKERLESLRPWPGEIDRNLNDWFRVELTYTSNAIEGNTLSRTETAMVVEKGLAVEGKTLTELQEAVNHAQAWDLVRNLTEEKTKPISENDILNIHQKILEKIDDSSAGRYRTVAVRIAGSRVVLPNPLKIPDLMKELVEWLSEVGVNPLKLAADAHYKLVSIHPFVDGNGRTARLLLNLILMRAGYPPAVIRKEDRNKYIDSLEKTQLGGSRDDYYQLIFTAIERSLDEYLTVIEKNETKASAKPEGKLKIGQVSQLSGETAATIRYWTKQGLLKPAGFSPGGYYLYNQEILELIKNIRQMQKEQRLSLEEIKKAIE